MPGFFFWYNGDVRSTPPIVRMGSSWFRLTLASGGVKSKLWSSAKADQMFSRWIRARDKRCFFCPNPATQNSHFWGRANSATRYDPENCDGICGGCHMRHEGNKQGLYREMKIKQLGQAGYDALQKRAYSIVKRSSAIQAFMEWFVREPAWDEQ